MAVTKQLYELQGLDDNIEHTRQTLDIKNSQLGDHKVLDEAISQLSAERKSLEEIKRQRREAEADVNDIIAKISEADKQLYSGRITNPKELSNLQHEVNTLNNLKDQLETKALEVIDRMEEAEKKVDTLTGDYQNLETEWNNEQRQLVKDIELLNKTLTELQQSRSELAEGIEPEVINLYEKIRNQKKPAVAKVEQGICRACRISLSAAVLQRARGSQPVQCGTCGRILFIS